MHQEAKYTIIAAFYAALQNPHIFGNVLSMSGSVHWKKDGFEKEIPWTEYQILFNNLNSYHLKFYIAAGELENEPLLTANRRLYEALKGKGYQILMKSFKVVMTVFGGVKSCSMD